MHRYILALWNPRESRSAACANAIRSVALSAADGWHPAYEATGAFAAHTGSTRSATVVYGLQNNAGVILGTLFENNQNTRAACSCLRFDEKVTHEIAESRGGYLVSHYWGTYIALIRDSHANAYHVFND